MARTDGIEVEGKVVEALPNALYRVELPNGHRVLAHFKGRAKANAVRLEPGETVRLEMLLFDLSNGAIVSEKKKL